MRAWLRLECRYLVAQDLDLGQQRLVSGVVFVQVAELAAQGLQTLADTVDLAARRHAELVAVALDLALHLLAHAHLCIDHGGVDLAEFLGQGDLGIGFLGRIDPEVVQGARRFDLATGLLALGELELEALGEPGVDDEDEPVARRRLAVEGVAALAQKRSEPATRTMRGGPAT